MANVLEEEFFAIEGRPHGCDRACLYVSELTLTPKGERITAEERAALWYMAFWSSEGSTRPSVMALAMHLDLSTRDVRWILFSLVVKGVLRSLLNPLEWGSTDEHAYVFTALEAQAS